jgi:hypothetical protein
MEIKTRFNVEDTVFFLTTTQDILAMGDHPQNKPFVCEGIVTSFRIGYQYEKLVISYTVKVRNGRCNDGSINWKWMEVEEGWLAPDLVQLGQNVSNRFRVNALVKENEKKKKRR